MKFYVVGGGMVAFLKAGGYDVVSDLEKADALLFTGGSDVTPSLYGAEKDARTNCSWARDVDDLNHFGIGESKGLALVGICRGAQFLNVMLGGTLHQHVEGHRGDHRMFTKNGDSMLVTSTHHQMLCLPRQEDCELIAWGKETTTPMIDVQPEVVHYPNHRALAVQYHPEYMDKHTRGFSYFFECLKEYLV